MRGIVIQLSTTPVKGLALLHPEEVVLGLAGVEHDRRFHLIDGDGRLVNAKAVGALVQVGATLGADATRLELRFPDGTAADGEVVLGERVETSFYGEPVPGRIVLGPWSEALSDLRRSPAPACARRERGRRCGSRGSRERLPRLRRLARAAR